MRIYTIGFTKKSAREFFELVGQSGAREVIDVRRHNVSQLAGFAKQDDLAYFLDALCGMSYRHDLQLAPTQEILDGYRKEHEPWQRFRERFLALIRDRAIERLYRPEDLDRTVLLCGEAEAAHCHRSFIVDYLAEQWGDVEVTHLGEG